jgi:hypothetical protein
VTIDISHLSGEALVAALERLVLEASGVRDVPLSARNIDTLIQTSIDGCPMVTVDPTTGAVERLLSDPRRDQRCRLAPRQSLRQKYGLPLAKFSPKDSLDF